MNEIEKQNIIERLIVAVLARSFAAHLATLVVRGLVHADLIPMAKGSTVSFLYVCFLRRGFRTAISYRDLFAEGTAFQAARLVLPWRSKKQVIRVLTS